MTNFVEMVQHQHWVEIVLQRPERLNAIIGPLIEDLTLAIHEINAQSQNRLIVLRGAGNAFCSGLDVDAFNADPLPDWHADYPRLWRDTHKAFYNSKIPIIGALQRCAINAGAALALACDALIVGKESFLQVGEVRQNFGIAYNASWLRLRHTEALGMRLVLTGDRVYGEELARLNIAFDCVSDDKVLDTIYEFATRLSEYPNNALANAKSTMRATAGVDADTLFDRATQAVPMPIPKPGLRHKQGDPS